MPLIRLELLRLLRERHVAVAIATFGAVLLGSSLTSWLAVRQDLRITAAVAAEERQRWLGQGEKDPHSAAHYSIYAFRPSRPLQAIDPGVVPFVGEAVWLEAHLQNDLLFRPQQDANAFERLGLVDPAGLLTRFGPLAVFLLAFVSAAREREHGVLGLALSAASTPVVYLGAKALSVTSAAIVALVVPVALTGALEIATSPFRTDDVIRMVGWTMGAVVYVAVLAAIAVSICVTTRSVQHTGAALLLVWVGLVLAALPAASAAAERWTPLPSFQAMKLRLAKDAPAYWTPETGAEQVAAILERYGVEREEDLPQTVNVRGAQLDVAERHAQAVFDREIGGFYDRIEAQDATYASFGWLSPAVAFDVASAAFAGTDFFHHRHFIDRAEQYRRALVNRMNAELIPHPAANGREHTDDIRLWSDVPAFEYSPPSMSSAVRSALLGMLALTFWLLVAVAVVIASCRFVRP